MHPRAHAVDNPLAPADSFEVPVVVRASSPFDPPRRPSRKAVDDAKGTLSAGQLPAPGAYLVPTTWREVLHAALTVGRDITPWLVNLPQLASREILARQSPLMAYLHRTPFASGHAVQANEIYVRGTEKSARAVFGYRLGMTMAEWLCWGQLGMSHSLHAESYQPAGADPDAWKSRGSLPDLIGRHTSHPQQWVVEAKGKRRLGQPALREGRDQLELSDVMYGSYRKLLCGTSIEHRLFMTLDIEDDRGRDGTQGSDYAAADLREDDIALFHEARASMLVYLLLVATPYQALSLRPVGGATEQRRRTRPGPAVELLEFDASTAEIRGRVPQGSPRERIREAGGIDMLTAGVPGTGMEVGMSRRLFGACARLAHEQATLSRIADAAVAWPDPDLLAAMEEPWQQVEASDSADDRRNDLRQAIYREEQAARLPDLLRATRFGFDAGQERDWEDFVEAPLETSLSREPKLESATADVYMAIDRSALL